MNDDCYTNVHHSHAGDVKGINPSPKRRCSVLENLSLSGSYRTISYTSSAHRIYLVCDRKRVCPCGGPTWRVKCRNVGQPWNIMTLTRIFLDINPQQSKILKGYRRDNFVIPSLIIDMNVYQAVVYQAVKRGIALKEVTYICLFIWTLDLGAMIVVENQPQSAGPSIGDWFNITISSYQYRNTIVEIKRFYYRPISTMGFPILVRRDIYFESVPRNISAILSKTIYDYTTKAIILNRLIPNYL